MKLTLSSSFAPLKHPEPSLLSQLGASAQTMLQFVSDKARTLLDWVSLSKRGANSEPATRGLFTKQQPADSRSLFRTRRRRAKTAEELKSEILRLTRQYSEMTHIANRPGASENPPPFTAGETTVPYAGRVFTPDEVQAAVSSTLDFWLTLGKEGDAFEREIAAVLG